MLVALWARFGWREAVGARVWAALALSLTGLALVAELPSGLSLVCYALLAAAVFWAVAQPWWSFPFAQLGGSTSLDGHLAGTSLPTWVLYAWLVALGTILPFALSIGSLRHLPATTVGIVATFEPVAASVVAWLWLGESLDAAQLIGGGIVLVGIVLAQTAR